MKIQYLIFAQRLGIFLLIVFILDFSIGKILEYFYLKINVSSPEQHTTFSIKHADTDIMVFGSSRAQHHYDPESFKDLPHSTFYNTGKDGQGIFYSWAILKSVLKRTKKSRIVILDININEFDKNQESYDRLSELLPYYIEHKEIQEIVNLKSPFEKVKALSYLYRYNSKILTIIKDNFFPTRDNKENGFEPIPTSDENLKLLGFYDQEEIDSLEIKAFIGFIQDAKANNQQVYVMVSPTYRNYYRGVPQSLKIAEEICKELDVPFLSFHQDLMFLKNPAYFSDPTHLNEIGAEIYSDKVLSLIMKSRKAERAS